MTKYATPTGKTNEPHIGNKINDQETKPGNISKARLVRIGCRLKSLITEVILTHLWIGCKIPPEYEHQKNFDC